MVLGETSFFKTEHWKLCVNRYHRITFYTSRVYYLISHDPKVHSFVFVVTACDIKLAPTVKLEISFCQNLLKNSEHMGPK